MTNRQELINKLNNISKEIYGEDVEHWYPTMQLGVLCQYLGITIAVDEREDINKRLIITRAIHAFKSEAGRLENILANDCDVESLVKNNYDTR